MNVAFALGRILLVVLFILSGAGKLLDPASTAEAIAQKFTMPVALQDYANQVATAVGMEVPKLLAIVVGVIEFVAGLLVAVNVLTRSAAVVLLIFAAVSTFYSDYYGVEKMTLSTNALQNLSIVGGLLMLAAMPRWYAREVVAAPEQLAPYDPDRHVVGVDR